MDASTALLIKTAYAEGVKRALMEYGLDEHTATVQSGDFTEEKLANVKDVESMIGRASNGKKEK